MTSERKSRLKLKTYKAARKYLIDCGIIRHDEEWTNTSIAKKFYSYKNVFPPSQGWMEFRKYLIGYGIIEISKPKKQKKVRSKITPEMSKLQVAKIYSNDLVQNATPYEKKIRQLLLVINKEITPINFIFQQPWTDTPTKEFYISDFYLPELKLTIEVDGKTHLAKEQKEKDARKEAFLLGKGIQTLRVRNIDAIQMDAKSLAKMLKLG